MTLLDRPILDISHVCGETHRLPADVEDSHHPTSSFADPRGGPSDGESSHHSVKVVASPMHEALSGDVLPSDYSVSDVQRTNVGGGSSRNSAKLLAAAKVHTPSCESSADVHHTCETLSATVVGTLSTSAQSRHASIDRPVEVDQSAIEPAEPGTATIGTAPTRWLELRIWAEMHNDAQLQRIATVNRAERGGVDGGLYAPYIEVVERAENTARLGLVRCYRRVVPASVREWQKSQQGIGEHLLARLLGHLGDPAVAAPQHWEGTGAKRVLVADPIRDRTLSELWQYCGHGDPTRRKAKGMSAAELAALGKPDLKMIVHLLAEACMKRPSGNTFRDIYEARRLETEMRVHAADCVRCGPSGKPALAGSPWSKAHQHADALRIVGKEILRDLWRVSQVES